MSYISSRLGGAIAAVTLTLTGLLTGTTFLFTGAGTLYGTTTAANITVTSTLSVAAGGVLNIADGADTQVLFLDASENVSSTSRVKINGNAGSVTSTRVDATTFYTNGTGAGQAFQSDGTADGYFQCAANCLLGPSTAHSLVLVTSNVSRWTIDSAGTITPSLTDGTLNIGAATARAGTIFGVSVSTTNATTTYAYARGDATRPAFAIVDPSNGGVNNGIGMSSTAYLNFITAGNIEMQAGPVNYSNSNFSAYVDNSFDLGQTLTSFRFRHLYLAGNAFSSTLNASTTAGSALDVLTTSGTLKFAQIAAAATGLQPLCVATGGGIVGYGAAGICPVSAFDVKENIKPISYGLDELLRTGFYDFTFKDKLNDGRTHSGPIADVMFDSIQSTMPNLVLRNKEGKVIGYDTNSMFGVLGQSIKELNAKVEAQQREIVELEARLKKLESK